MAEERGYAIHEVSDGVEAVEAALRLLPAAVVLDRVLPRLRAEEVAERLRANPVTQRVPAVRAGRRGGPRASAPAVRRLHTQAFVQECVSERDGHPGRAPNPLTSPGSGA